VISMTSLVLICATGLLSFWFTTSSLAKVVMETVSKTPHQYDFHNPPQCTLRMSGGITDGDFDYVRQYVERFRTNYEGDIIYLCLNSNGGSYPETLKIVEWLLSGEGRGIGTVVPAEAKCFSACAFVFMAGNFEYDHGQVPARWLHVRGQLGFHAPYSDYYRAVGTHRVSRADRPARQKDEPFMMPFTHRNTWFLLEAHPTTTVPSTFTPAAKLWFPPFR